MRWIAILSVFVLTAACSARQTPALPAGATATKPARASAPVRQLQTDLTNVFGAAIMSRGVWAVDVRSLDTGEKLYQLNQDRLMMPASNLKIVTLAAAADTLGWDYRFPTSLETTATRGTITTTRLRRPAGSAERRSPRLDSRLIEAKGMIPPCRWA